MWPKIDMFHFLSTSGTKFNNRINIGEKPKKIQTAYKFIFQYIYRMLDTRFMLFGAPVAVLGTKNDIQKKLPFYPAYFTVSESDCIICTVNMAVQIIVDTHTIINNRIFSFVLFLEIKINSFQELRRINEIKNIFLNEIKLSFDKAMSTYSASNPLAPTLAPSQAISSAHCPFLCASPSSGLLQSSVVLATTRLEATDAWSGTTVCVQQSSTTSDEPPRYSVALAATTSVVIISDAYSAEKDDAREAGLLTPLTRESLLWRQLGIFPRAASAEDLENQTCKLQDRLSLLLQAQNQTPTASASFSSELPAITDVENGQV
jgi:hypothetical protein